MRKSVTVKDFLYIANCMRYVLVRLQSLEEDTARANEHDELRKSVTIMMERYTPEGAIDGSGLEVSS